MAEFVKQTFMCRAKRPCRLYALPYDTTPANMTLQKGDLFYSRKTYKSDAVTLLTVDEPANGGEIPIGYWCPLEYLDTILVEEDPMEETGVGPDGSIAVNETLLIKAVGPITYASADEATSVPNGLAVGDQIICDRKIEVAINGMVETRYHIQQVIGDDTTVEGLWITVDRAVSSPDGPTVLIHNQALKRVAMRAAPTTYAATYAAVANADAGGGGSSPQITTPDGTSVTPPDSVVVGDPVENDPVINHIDMNSPEGMQQVIDAYGFDYATSSGQGGASSLMGIPLGRLLFVHGMPFQYTYLTDRRNGGTGTWGKPADEDNEGVAGGSADMYGRAFGRDIAANTPIAVFTPGKPKFLTTVKQGVGGTLADASDGVRNMMLPILGTGGGGEGGFDSMLAQLNDVDGDYNYYSMEVDTKGYYEYVNSLCRSSARLMGVGSETYRGKKCEDFDWGAYNEAAEQEFSVFQRVVGLDKGVSFAFDPQSSISDTISNQTGDSQFAGLFNDISSKARELEFILGETGTGINEMIDSASYSGVVMSELNTGAFAGAKNAIDRIGNWLTHTAHGMNIRFPEIWNESQHSPSYEIDMHFITPYATNFCKWRYVLVPFFHLFCLASPKSDSNITQYSSPYLVRAYSKAYFNIELGMIDSLTWKRFGDGDMISDDGIPTQIDVSVSIKDLYHTLAMTNMYGEGGVSLFMNNTGLMDLLGTLSGVNMNRLSIGQRMQLFVANNWSVFTSLGENFMRAISDRVRNTTVKLGFWRN